MGFTGKWLYTTTHHHPPPPPHTTKISMSAISQLSLAPCWPNFKDRLLGPYWTDSICSGDICPSNICPGDICPYQEYLSCYRPHFDQNLKVGSWDHFEHMPTATATFIQVTFVLVTFAYKRNISAVTDPILTKLFNKIFSWPWIQILFGPKFSLTKTFWT